MAGEFVLHYDGYHTTAVLAFPEDASRAQVEDVLDWQREKLVRQRIEERQRLAGQHRATPEERVELAAVLRDVRAYYRRKMEGRGKVIFIPRG